MATRKKQITSKQAAKRTARAAERHIQAEQRQIAEAHFSDGTAGDKDNPQKLVVEMLAKPRNRPLPLRGFIELHSNQITAVVNRLAVVEERVNQLAEKVGAIDLNQYAHKNTSDFVSKLDERVNQLTEKVKTLEQNKYPPRNTFFVAELAKRVDALGERERSHKWQLTRLTDRVGKLEQQQATPEPDISYTFSPITADDIVYVDPRAAESLSKYASKFDNAHNLVAEYVPEGVSLSAELSAERAAEGWANQVHQLDRDGYTAGDVRRSASAAFIAGVRWASRWRDPAAEPPTDYGTVIALIQFGNFVGYREEVGEATYDPVSKKWIDLDPNKHQVRGWMPRPVNTEDHDRK